MRPRHLAVGFTLAAFMLAAVVLAGCGGQSKFGDGVIDIAGAGQGMSRVEVEIIGLKALKRSAEICVAGEPLPFGLDNPCAGDPGRQDKAAKAIPRSEERRVGKECRSRWS